MRRADWATWLLGGYLAAQGIGCIWTMGVR